MQNRPAAARPSTAQRRMEGSAGATGAPASSVAWASEVDAAAVAAEAPVAAEAAAAAAAAASAASAAGDETGCAGVRCCGAAGDAPSRDPRGDDAAGVCCGGDGGCCLLSSSSSPEAATTARRRRGSRLKRRELGSLPAEMLEGVLLFLTASEMRVKAAAVCRQWRRTVQHGGPAMRAVLRMHGVLAVGGWDGLAELSSVELWGQRGGCALGEVEAHDREWSFLPSMRARRSHVGCAVVDRRVYVAGGRDGEDRLRSFECFDPLAGTWQVLPDMHERRSSLAFQAVGRVLYALGGFDGETEHASCEMFDLGAGAWTKLPDLDTRQSQMASVCIGEKIYLIGGCRNNTLTNQLLCYDTATRTCEYLRPMKEHRVSASAAVLDGLIYVLGGANEGSCFFSVECYDPRSDTWTMATQLPYCRLNLGCVAFEGTILAVGGYASEQLQVVDQFYPATHPQYKGLELEASTQMPTDRLAILASQIMTMLSPPKTPSSNGQLRPLQQAEEDHVQGMWHHCQYDSPPPLLLCFFLLLFPYIFSFTRRDLSHSRDAVAVCSFD